MKRIFKYELNITDGIQTIDLPYGHNILKYGVQPSDSVGGFETLVFWALIDDELPSDNSVNFRIVGTGQEIDFAYPVKDGLRYKDTVQMPSGLVWHIFNDSMNFGFVGVKK